MSTLSIVIPCYNEEATLEKCVERVLAIENEGVKLELVIVDDCSTDRSVEVATSLTQKHPQIRLVRHEANQGKGAALRTGFQEVSGDYRGSGCRFGIRPARFAAIDRAFGGRPRRRGLWFAFPVGRYAPRPVFLAFDGQSIFNFYVEHDDRP